MINIITSYYTSRLISNLNEERNNELKDCLNNNINNTLIEKIHLFIDDEEAFEYIKKINSEKINVISVGKKPLYFDLFNYAISNLKNKICMITNSDIYIKECDVNIFKNLEDNNTVFALTRYEYDLSCPLITNYEGSHDCFIFKSPINNVFINNIYHSQHAWGAENIVLYELKNAGINIYNPCYQIKIVHHHASNLREENRPRINFQRSHIVYPSIINIVFIIPSTSRNCNYLNIEESVIMTILHESISKFDISPYKFVLGFDDNDVFYLNNVDKLKTLLPNNFYFHFYNNYNKSYSCIVNQLANTAINEYNAEYLFLAADDLYFHKLDFLNDFVTYIKSNNNLALGQPIDKTNISFKHGDEYNQKVGICTHPFIHKNHVNYLGYLIPPQIKNWYCDNWITMIYRSIGKVITSNDYVIENKIYDKRYEIHNVHPNELNELIIQARNIFLSH
jgi:hypothetical protein